LRFHSVLLLAAVSFAPFVAKAESVFDVSATLGNIQGSTHAGTDTGLTFTGTVAINTTTGAVGTILLTLQNHANPVVHLFEACPPTCIFVNSTAFDLYGLVDLTGGASLVGYSGGSLRSDSELTADSNPYNLTGTVTEELSGAPEPASWLAVAAGLGALYLAYRRRRFSNG
jgi:hypothetical protein